ncbi:MAG: hypothetical protein GXP25_24785 [Planctomycetes bacterium]|nr:hypothetical protein [Planctomycetota bacterium]
MVHNRIGVWFAFALVVGLLLVPWKSAWAGESYATSFEKGKDLPAGWNTSGICTWEKSGGHGGKRCLSVTDDDTKGALWRCKAVWMQPHKFYRYTVWVRSESPDKAPRVRVGTNFANHDYVGTPEWQQKVFTFWAPTKLDNAELWLGVWRLNGKDYFDDLKVEPVGVSFFRKGNIVLGESERIEKGAYIFDWKIRPENSAYARVIQDIHTESRGGSIRFWEPWNGYFVHKYYIPGHRQLSGTIFIGKINIVKGECIFEASKDGKKWDEITRLKEGGRHEIRLPRSLFPASEIFVKALFPAEAQLSEYRYEAPLEGTPADLVGHTNYFRGHLLIVKNGPLSLRFECGLRELVSISADGNAVGWVGTKLAQFAGVGKGYKGSGMGVTNAATVKSFQVRERSDTKCVVDVTCEWSDVGEGLQACSAVVRFTVYAGQRWFESRVLSITNMGTAKSSLRGYGLTVQPANQAVAKPKCYGGYSVWLQGGNSLAAVALDEGDFTLGFRTTGGSAQGDVSRSVEATIGPGKTWEAKEPALFLGVIPSPDEAGAFREVQRIRPMLASPRPSGKITYEEEKAGPSAPENQK